MSRNACSNENGENSVKNRQADFASTNLTKTRQTRQFRRADCALTNLTITFQNRQIHEHLLGLTKFRQICHFCYCVHSGHNWLDMSEGLSARISSSF